MKNGDNVNDEKIYIQRNQAESIASDLSGEQLQPKYMFDNLVEALMRFGTGYGPTGVALTKEDIVMLSQGKVIAYTDGEYNHFIFAEELEQE